MQPKSVVSLKDDDWVSQRERSETRDGQMTLSIDLMVERVLSGDVEIFRQLVDGGLDV